ncbi:HNH endonuclease signature motif containing protein [Nocardioides sp.]|uniref:HNH endonuclease signature motif containing protein n=1 Tax=Nocardioides sp. TaxID=35761 RepID=UPI002716D515|nr:HNH endonuclease signature motif containing protein [Nocardioides sp.]MDO9458254.1 HNH endonuclease signature motif containing protein [Nocardioides sp.]
MTALADETIATPAMLLAEVRRSRVAVDALEAHVMGLAVEWAHAHPAPDGARAWRVTAATAVPLGELDGAADEIDVTDPECEEAVGWIGIPPVAWDAPAAFAAANGMSTAAGKALIRDALILHHRLPRVWERVTAGAAPAWRARKVAQLVIGSPADVVTHIDTEVAPIVGTVSAATLERKLEAAMLLLHAEARELDQECAEEHHHVTPDDPAADGSVTLTARGDWKDVHDLLQTVARIAAALKETEGPDSLMGLDARRARALGVLADPAQALALLDGTDAPAPGKKAVVYLHLTDLAVLGADPVGFDETTRRPVLVQQVREWLARTDTHVVVKPVLDLAEELHTEAYAVPDRLREQTKLVNPTCVFPWCTRPTECCDCDHIEPWDPAPGGGPTCSHNIAPLCRHHHRLKTHTAWTYRRLEPRVFLWTDPYGTSYLHDRGTTNCVCQT